MDEVTRSGLDVLRNRVLSGLVTRMPVHVGRLEWNRAQLAVYQRDQLRALLVAAIDGSPFHARRLGGIDPSRFELADLGRLPVMTKAEMMADFDNVVPDRRLTREVVERHLAASTASPSLLFDEYVCLASGGSSGERGVFVQTVDEYVEFLASLVRRPVPTGPSPAPRPVAVVAAASPVHSTGLTAAILAGGAVGFVSLPATLSMSVTVARLQELQPGTLMGYPSRLAVLAREQLAGKLSLSLDSITATSEPLSEDDRTLLTTAFGVPVVNQYASTEGVAGRSEPGELLLAFATDVVLVELVDEHGRGVPPGTRSDKVLVTNLCNRTQPIIRYELTDAFRQADDDPWHGWLRATAEGRSDESFRYGTIVVHPLSVRTVMVKAPAVVEYQVRQTERGVDVSVVVAGALDSDWLVQQLAAGLRDAGLTAPVVHVELVETLPRHPQTGKVPRFVPLTSPARPGRPDRIATRLQSS